MNSEPKKPVNKKLISISVLILAFLLPMADIGTQIEIETFTDYFATAIAFLLLYPLLVIWFRAIWNEVAHKIFDLPTLNSWQASGILVFVLLLLG